LRPSESDPARRLDRGLTASQCFTLGFGSIIGTGWLLVLGSWLDQAGPLGAILAFAAGGVLMMSVALCYGEMATTLPVTGGEVAYAYRVFGIEASFAIGWLLALVYIGVTAFEAISAAWLIGALIPGSEGPILYTIEGSPVRLSTLVIGLGGTVFLAFLNIRGIKFAARFQDTFTWSKILISVLFIGAGIAFGDVTNLEPLFRSDQSGGAWKGGLGVFVTTAFWYTGFNMIPQAMGEITPGTSMRRV
jgi:amino acid transporter